MTGQRSRDRRREPELVHGLTEPVELADWDYAIILAALKLYRCSRLEAGDVTRARYVDHIMGKLRRPFAELVRRTKRKHRKLKALGADGQLTLTTIDLEEVVPGDVGGDLPDDVGDDEEVKQYASSVAPS